MIAAELLPSRRKLLSSRRKLPPSKQQLDAVEAETPSGFALPVAHEADATAAEALPGTELQPEPEQEPEPEPAEDSTVERGAFDQPLPPVEPAAPPPEFVPMEAEPAAAATGTWFESMLPGSGQPAEPSALEIAAAHAQPILPGREPTAPAERAELARVDAELLDDLLNNAGEVSIFRARIEQQMTSIEFNLAELDRTVTRLREQLRKLEMETEAQILFRHQQEDAAHRADFDPLELDRYSTIQQLSRALAESVSDVASIEGLLENLNRETQNLLQQQGRVVTEVQNGLMRTRMVPFQRHVQRLQPPAAPGRARKSARRPSSSSRARRANSTGRCSSACCRRSSTCCAMR